ncbi:hypothetical protein QA639_34455 [Bradyrhizobium pachyrhizi]|uniref:hypothetical protein n=1 Tax=Bradyrhizobium pachyrhizi TaxID=280333 RepID=UPI0024B235FB|nr:hypothetical protein [Bradyrhizobium pachyrhizi]WFU54651.1 hypothetical protein QA639_34455 [Bradyrhizobium pachyrhizi]
MLYPRAKPWDRTGKGKSRKIPSIVWDDLPGREEEKIMTLSFVPNGAALLLVGCIVSSCPAHADISNDLKFCAGLASGKERLACYDAAARIEERSNAVQQHAAIPPSSAINPKRAIPTASRPVGRFDGGYIGGTIGYDINLTSAGTVSNAYPYPYFLNSYPNVPSDSVHGSKLGLLAGYNATSGPLLIGFEARYQYNFNRTSASATNDHGRTSLPFTTLSLTCYACDQSFLDNYPINNISQFNLRSITTSKIELSRPQQADVSFRAGITHEDWLLFSKIGLGAEEVVSVSTTDNSALSAIHRSRNGRDRTIAP